MPDAHVNFAYSTVATAPVSPTAGTSLVVATGDGALFPAVPFNAVICPASTQPTATNAEVVRVTTRSTDTLTITRAQESSTARSVVVGDQIFAAVTAKSLTDIESSAAGDLGQPGLITPLAGMGYGTTTATFTAARANIGRFYTTRAYSITLAAFFLVVSAGSNDPVEIAVYDASYARLATSGQVLAKLNATATTVQTVPITVSLAANTIYYVAINNATIGGAAAQLLAFSFTQPVATNLFGSTAGKRLMAWQGSLTTTMPNPFVPTNDQNSMPIIALRES